MLIGICGRMGAGKDTVGAYLVARHNFARYAFADQLKVLAREIGWNGEKDEHGRWLLQHLGMGCRAVFGARCWIEAVELAIDTDGRWLSGDANVVVTDVRLPNEAVWIKAAGGFVWRVVRPEIDRGGDADRHATEAHIDELPVDVELVNNGTLDDLYCRVEGALEMMEEDR